MKPGHIKFFDGLRITTEHMNHLQGSFHSGFQDIRQILGIGKVYYGFEVLPGDEQSVTIQPGLAFDYHKNRIACDETITLEVEFESDENTKYVCVKYEQVEDGLIEGQATLIWDSCSALLREDVPEPEENLIPIAKLVRSENGDGTFEIISLLAREQDKESEEAAIQDQQPGEAEKDSENGEVLEEEEDFGEAGTESASSASNEEESAAELTEGAASEPEHWSLQVRQGVMRLAAEPGSQDYLSTVVIQALTEKLISGGDSEQEELVFALAEREVALDFPISSLTCQTIISSTFSASQPEENEEPAPTGEEEEIPSPSRLEFRSTARGEATFTGATIPQFGVSMLQIASDGAGWWTSELTEQGIAHLPFNALLEGSRDVWDILQYLQLFVRIDRSDDQGFRIICNLLWKGEISEGIILKIRQYRFRFVWSTLIAWKALGELQQKIEKEDM
jgi:hypothetical protein